MGEADQINLHSLTQFWLSGDVKPSPWYTKNVGSLSASRVQMSYHKLCIIHSGVNHRKYITGLSVKMNQEMVNAEDFCFFSRAFMVAKLCRNWQLAMN